MFVFYCLIRCICRIHDSKQNSNYEKKKKNSFFCGLVGINIQYKMVTKLTYVNALHTAPGIIFYSCVLIILKHL